MWSIAHTHTHITEFVTRTHTHRVRGLDHYRYVSSRWQHMWSINREAVRSKRPTPPAPAPTAVPGDGITRINGSASSSTVAPNAAVAYTSAVAHTSDTADAPEESAGGAGRGEGEREAKGAGTVGKGGKKGARAGAGAAKNGGKGENGGKGTGKCAEKNDGDEGGVIGEAPQNGVAI